MNEENLIEQTKRLLDASEQQVDSSIKARLRAARYQALESLQSENQVNTRRSVSKSFIPRWLAPFSTLTMAASIMMIATMLWTLPSVDLKLEDNLLNDIQILSNQEDLELYKDLDFYIWLSDEENFS